MGDYVENRPSKFSQVSGGKSGSLIGMSASEVIYNSGGKLVHLNTSTGFGEISDDGETPIGWVVLGEQTCSSTAGNTKAWMVTDKTAVFRIPVIYDNSTYTTNYAETLKMETCDVKVSTYQYANLTTTTENGIVIVGGKAAAGTTISPSDGYVDVMLNPNTAIIGTDN